MNDLPKCARCEENQARYIDEIGLLVCGTCPIAGGFDSIRLADVPQLLQWARDILAGGFMNGYSFGELRKIVGKHPNETGGNCMAEAKNKWPCPGKPEALAGMPIGMYHCEFCGEMQLAGSTHLAPQFPSQWEEPFPKVEEPPDYGPVDDYPIEVLQRAQAMGVHPERLMPHEGAGECSVCGCEPGERHDLAAHDANADLTGA